MSTKRPTLTQQLTDTQEELAVARKRNDLQAKTLESLCETAGNMEAIVRELRTAVDAVSARAQSIARQNAELTEQNQTLRRENDRLRMRRGPIGAVWDFVMGPPRA